MAKWIAILSLFLGVSALADALNTMPSDMIGTWQGLGVSCSGQPTAWPNFTVVVGADGSYTSVYTGYPGEDANCQVTERATYTVNADNTMTIVGSYFYATQECSFPSYDGSAPRTFPIDLTPDGKYWTVNGGPDARYCPEGGYLIWTLERGN